MEAQRGWRRFPEFPASARLGAAGIWAGAAWSCARGAESRPLPKAVCNVVVYVGSGATGKDRPPGSGGCRGAEQRWVRWVPGQPPGRIQARWGLSAARQEGRLGMSCAAGFFIFFYIYICILFLSPLQNVWSQTISDLGGICQHQLWSCSLAELSAGPCQNPS